jgi:hypothetical protein
VTFSCSPERGALKAVGILATTAAVLLLMVGLFSYLVLPDLIEHRLAADLRQEYGLEKKPEVQVSSGFPPGLLLGRMDRIEVHIDQMIQEGILLRDIWIDLKGLDISLLSLVRGELEGEIRTTSLRAEVPEESINEYLQRHDLEWGSGEVEISPGEVVYRRVDALFGFPASVSLEVQVGGPRTVEVVPERVTVAGFVLPSSLARSLPYGSWTLNLGELPFGSELQSVEPSENALIVRAAK